jgi:hypothetical protein
MNYSISIILLLFIISLTACSKKTSDESPPTAIPRLSITQVEQFLNGKVFKLTDLYSKDGSKNKNNMLNAYDLDDTYVFDSSAHIVYKWDNEILNPLTETRLTPLWYRIITGENGEVQLDWQDPVTYEPDTFTVESLNLKECTILFSRQYLDVDSINTMLFFEFKTTLGCSTF